jgi:osmotically-inducible protein OsmY
MSPIFFLFLAAYPIAPTTSYPAQATVAPSDQALADKISKVLNEGRRLKKYENVSFYVSYGNVTLQGTVDTLDDKNQVKRDVLAVQGVRQIDNQIIVEPPPPKYK